MGEFQKRNLWAPWRMEYIDGLNEKAGQGCFLCHALASSPDEDEQNQVLWRDARTLALLNRFPYSTGHTLVAPVAHVGQPEDLPDDVFLSLTGHKAEDTKGTGPVPEQSNGEETGES